MRRQVTAFGVLYASTGDRRILAFVDILAVKTVAGVSWKTRAREAAQRVGAVGEHVARPVLAFVLVWHLTRTSTVSVVTMAKGVETRAVLTGRSFFSLAVVRALEFSSQFIGPFVTVLFAIA
jgi:hypothetical protein